MSNTTEDWTEGLSEKDIEFYHKIESIGSGELKGWPRAPQGRLRVKHFAHPLARAGRDHHMPKLEVEPQPNPADPVEPGVNDRIS